MNRELVGEPGVSAFLLSVLRNLGGISRMKTSYDTYLYYDPREDLEKLREKMVFFQGLVVDGEAKRLDDRGVDEWMDGINDLVYDVEDIFDDIKILPKDPQVSINYEHLEEFSKDINSRFKKILARAEKLGEEADTLKLERVSTGHAFRGGSKVTVRTRETSSVVDISEIHGREVDQIHIVKRLLEVDGGKRNIVKRLLKVDGGKRKKNYDVLCIVGMGGLGKTTLAQLVFNAPEVEKHFKVKSWVCISNVFDAKRATKELIENSSRGSGDLKEQSLANLQRRLTKMVGNKRFLFVLDDVWSSSEWETMKAPFNSCANGSKILVTTRKIQIAHALGNKNPYQLRELNNEKCVEIFMDKAFEDDEVEEEKVDLVEKIVRACGGVPLVVKVIGSMLQVADVEKWRAVSENTASWANENDEIHPAIRFSYYDLPAYLKRCFQYLAVFPPDYQLDQDDVVRLWIADGLVVDKEGRMAEDIGAEYYTELKARSLIQENDMMHDIVHHLATVLSRKFCYKENSKEPPASVRHAFLVKPNAMHCEFLTEAPGLRTLIVRHAKDENVLLNTISSCKMLRALSINTGSKSHELSLGESFIEHLTFIRYLTIYSSDITHLPDPPCMLNNLQFLNLCWNRQLSSLPESICALSQLRVLIIFRSCNLIQLPKDMGTLRSLRTLHLVDISITSLPESICALSQLQDLNVQGCRNLIQLPKDIGNLKSLRTLNLRYTFMLISVPDSIVKVTGLQYLRVDKHHQLPLHIGRLARLKELKYYPVGKEEGRGLGELNLMNMLQGRLIIGRMENIGGVEDAKIADLRSKKNVTRLEFEWSEPGNDEEMEVKRMEALEPHNALDLLKFSNYGGDKFPAWIMSSNVCFSVLTSLSMKGLNKIREMIDMEFVSLEDLTIENCSKLRKILMVTPRLKRLYMRNCGELEAASVYLLPSLSDKAGLHSILSQLDCLECAYNIFEYFCDKLIAANSKWDKLDRIELSGGGKRIASLPEGWPSIMVSLEAMEIREIEEGKFQFVPDGDQSAFPPSLHNLSINGCVISERLPHHLYTITSDGKVELSEETI